MSAVMSGGIMELTLIPPPLSQAVYKVRMHIYHTIVHQFLSSIVPGPKGKPAIFILNLFFGKIFNVSECKYY